MKVAVATNPNTCVQDLLDLVPSELAPYSNQELAQALASNPRSTAEVLRRVAALLASRIGAGRDDHVALAAGIARCSRPAAPLDSIQELLEPWRGTAQFRKVVAREATRKDVLEWLHQDPASRVQRALERRAERSQGQSARIPLQLRSRGNRGGVVLAPYSGG